MAKVMIVDDAAFMRLRLRILLVESGHEVVAEATNGREAVHIYMKFRPDLVTMDMSMPELDGIGAVREICKIDPSAKIIMCSAMGQAGMALDAICSGAKDCVVKPFQQECVIESINKVLSI